LRFLLKEPFPMSAGTRPLHYDSLRQLLLPRPRDAHKGHFGHVLVVGGAAGFGGAALMAAEASARCGAGLTSVATHPSHVPALLARRPELMVHGLEQPDLINALLQRASVLVLGPGLGQESWGQQLFRQALQAAQARELPLVLDADALNLLSKDATNGKPLTYSKWILTPHVGEAARLLQQSPESIQADREAAARHLQQRYGGVSLLKGAGSLVCCDQQGRQQLETCMHGNPGMASGGMGDVLSGVLGALLAQGFDPATAARLGVCLHGKAADLEAAAHGERGLLATDLLPHLRTLLNP
jgi:hydroxyethylthiazole kinase-like uncharacterized protein yjeF